MQHALTSLKLPHTLAVALVHASDKHDDETMLSCLRACITLLLGGNRRVQDSFAECLRQDSHVKLSEVILLLVSPRKQDGEAVEIHPLAAHALKFVQLMCENHVIEHQQLFTDKFPKAIASITIRLFVESRKEFLTGAGKTY